MGRDTHDQAARTGATTAAGGGFLHPECEACGFAFRGSRPVFVCEGGDAPTAGRCSWCIQDASGARERVY